MFEYLYLKTILIELTLLIWIVMFQITFRYVITKKDKYYFLILIRLL